MIDTTESMQPAIDNLKTSLNTKIIPTILNGDSAKGIPAIPGAHLGLGTFRDVPWLPWGLTTDEPYSWRFRIAGATVYGNVAPPRDNGGVLQAPESVEKILGSLQAAGGGDAPEAAGLALFMAATDRPVRLGNGGLWPPAQHPLWGAYSESTWGPQCGAVGRVGRACFRAGKLPIFAVITDAAFHNGATPANDYLPAGVPSGVGGAKTYQEVVAALQSASAKVVGVPLNTGLPGAAAFDLGKLARDTGSVYQTPGGVAKPLVAERDSTSGELSDELVRLIGLLAGQGLNNVTTVRSNYACPGNMDCTGDNIPDHAYENPQVGAEPGPFNAVQLISSVRPVEVPPPAAKPYLSVDASTFYGVRGDATVEFEVTAENTVVKPTRTVVVRVLLEVQTPSGLSLGGPEGVKVIYLVIPPGSTIQ